jgi:hypothetical protein
MTERIPVKKTIIYSFYMKDKQFEKPFDVPEGVTSYPKLSLLVSLSAHIRLEWNRNSDTPELASIWTEDKGDVTYVYPIFKKGNLEIYTSTYNIIRIHGTGF